MGRPAIHKFAPVLTKHDYACMSRVFRWYSTLTEFRKPYNRDADVAKCKEILKRIRDAHL